MAGSSDSPLHKCWPGGSLARPMSFPCRGRLHRRTGCDEQERGIMRFLLTSAGRKNASIRDALVDLLGKPIAESSALCIPTAGYGHPQGTPAGARARGRVLPSCVRSCFRARRSGPRLRLRPCGRIRSASGDRARPRASVDGGRRRGTACHGCCVSARPVVQRQSVEAPGASGRGSSESESQGTVLHARPAE